MLTAKEKKAYVKEALANYLRDIEEFTEIVDVAEAAGLNPQDPNFNDDSVDLYEALVDRAYDWAEELGG